MDNIRLILVLALVFVLMLIWQAWEQDYGQRPPQAQMQTQGETNPAQAAPVPTDAPPAAPEMPTPGAVPQVAASCRRTRVSASD